MSANGQASFFSKGGGRPATRNLVAGRMPSGFMWCESGKHSVKESLFIIKKSSLLNRQVCVNCFSSNLKPFFKKFNVNTDNANEIKQKISEKKMAEATKLINNIIVNTEGCKSDVKHSSSLFFGQMAFWYEQHFCPDCVEPKQLELHFAKYAQDEGLEETLVRKFNGFIQKNKIEKASDIIRDVKREEEEFWDCFQNLSWQPASFNYNNTVVPAQFKAYIDADCLLRNTAYKKEEGNLQYIYDADYYIYCNTKTNKYVIYTGKGRRGSWLVKEMSLLGTSDNTAILLRNLNSEGNQEIAVITSDKLKSLERNAYYHRLERIPHYRKHRPFIVFQPSKLYEEEGFGRYYRVPVWKYCEQFRERNIKLPPLNYRGVNLLDGRKPLNLQKLLKQSEKDIKDCVDFIYKLERQCCIELRFPKNLAEIVAGKLGRLKILSHKDILPKLSNFIKKYPLVKGSSREKAVKDFIKRILKEGGLQYQRNRKRSSIVLCSDEDVLPVISDFIKKYPELKGSSRDEAVRFQEGIKASSRDEAVSDLMKHCGEEDNPYLFARLKILMTNIYPGKEGIYKPPYVEDPAIPVKVPFFLKSPYTKELYRYVFHSNYMWVLMSF